jgi:dTDP-glucose pyrophosphorylase/predicted acetyltransferase
VKALILAAGRGTRMRPISDEIPKALVPIAHRPLISYIIQNIRMAGITDIGVVVSPDSEIPKAISGVEFIVQKKPLGLADAVRCARRFIGNEPFLLHLGDIFYRGDLTEFVADFTDDARILTTRVKNPTRFGVVEFDELGVVRRVVEKPKSLRNKWICAGIYAFQPSVFKVIDTLKPSKRGEYEITDAIQKMTGGKKVLARLTFYDWFDVGEPKAMHSLEKRIETYVKGERIYLRDIRMFDLQGNYPRWMNDKEVVRYLESRFARQTKPNIREFVRKTLANENAVFLAIMAKNHIHIGNIKLSIDRIHKTAEIGIVIGERAYWGKGYATEAIKTVSRYAFGELGLHKLTAGVYSDNIGSLRAFLKAGFVEEGRLREQYISDGKRVDRIIVGRIK